LKKDFFSKLLEMPAQDVERQVVPMPEPKPIIKRPAGYVFDTPMEGVETLNQYGENCETHDSALFVDYQEWTL